MILESMSPAVAYWIQLAGWVVGVIAVVGGAYSGIRSFHQWSAADDGRWLRSLAALFGYIALAAIGIVLTLIGPQQI
ncbi:MAG: hypothetical protein JNM47_12495 [Hyphomonadaceae bacterium]|nr:hypothetical protein [Hyphomonadaceae bacterium]